MAFPAVPPVHVREGNPPTAVQWQLQGPLPQPVFHLKSGSYLASDRDGIIILTDQNMLNDTHVAGNRAQRRWHQLPNNRHAGPSVSTFNDANNAALMGLDHTRFAPSGALNSGITVMANLRPYVSPTGVMLPAGIAGAGPGGHHNFRLTLRRILNRFMDNNLANPPGPAPGPNPWAVKPNSIAIQLIGTGPNHGYQRDITADIIIEEVVNWFHSPVAATSLARRNLIRHVDLLVPKGQLATEGPADLCGKAWKLAWRRHFDDTRWRYLARQRIPNLLGPPPQLSVTHGFRMYDEERVQGDPGFRRRPNPPRAARPPRAPMR